MLVSPNGAYIKMLVLPFSQHVPTAIQRAFSPTGRMSPINPDITENWENGLSFHPFDIATTSLEFEWSRRSGNPSSTMLASNVTAIYTLHFQETLIGGVLQGRKQLDPKGASAICRKSMWNAAKDVVTALDMPSISDIRDAACYNDFKNCQELRYRRVVKDNVRNVALKGWVRNEGDDSFT
jgi:tRNA-specific adenosine deaminase 1